MAPTPEELREDFLKRRANGEAMPRPAFSVAERSYPAAKESTPTPAIPINRDGTIEEQLREIMAGVASLLGEWRLRPIDEESRNSWAYIDGPDGAAICGGVGRWGIGPGRIEISGEWPKSGQYRCDQYSPHGFTRITVSLSRSAESIANDIERRFLAEYLAEYAKQLENRARGDNRQNHQNAVTRRLAAIIGAKRLNRGYHGEEHVPADHFTGHDTAAPLLDSCDVDLDGEATIKIRYCSEVMAAAILRLLLKGGDDENETNSGT